jgi:hypothetical protein
MSAVAAQQKSVDSVSTEVLAVENARTNALDRNDVAALDKILRDDLTYVHASGKVDSKASMLEAIRSGQMHYISWEAKTMHVRMIGDPAVLNGEYLVRVADRGVQPGPFDVNIFILSVYARRDGRWQTDRLAIYPRRCAIAAADKAIGYEWLLRFLRVNACLPLPQGSAWPSPLCVNCFHDGLRRDFRNLTRCREFFRLLDRQPQQASHVGAIQISRFTNCDVPNLFPVPLQNAPRIGEFRPVIKSQVDVLGVNGDVTKALLQSPRKRISHRHCVVRIVDRLRCTRRLGQHEPPYVQGQRHDFLVVYRQKL